MSDSWLPRRGVRQAAVFGLAIGLAALAALTLGGTLSTRRATAQVRASNQISMTWGDVFVQISNEDQALHQYLATGAELDRTGLVTAIGSAEPDLVWLAAHGGNGEKFQVTMLRHDYVRYQHSLRTIYDAGGRQDQTEIDANLQSTTNGFAALRRQAVANIERQQRELNNYLAAVDRRNRALRSLAIVVFVADLAMFSLCIAILIGYQRRVERQAVSSHHKAMHDSLTGLANRMLFRDRADQALRIAARTREPVGLIGLDLDGFKQVNDTLGHHAGDLLLKHVADRIQECVRETDTIARLGGDEFSIVLPNVTSIDDAAEVADRVLHAIRRPIDLDGELVEVSASIGVAVFPSHGEHTEELIQHSDAAMYQAKRGKLGVCLYEPQDQPDAAGSTATHPIPVAPETLSSIPIG
jgi:diguanylate cyclase (GGDEF)-like protein